MSEAAYTELLHSPAADPISGSTETEMTVLPAAFDQTTTGSSQPEVYSPPSLNSADGSAPPVGESPAHSVPQNHFSRPVSETPHGDDDEAFESICAAFDDEAEEIRGAAARSLYESSENPVESFTRALREATPERRREIGASIAASGLAQESISQLTGESRERTYEAFSLLFLMAKAGEVQPLLRAIEGHPSNEVRLAVVKLLALSGQKEVLPAFRRLKTQSSLPAEVRDAITEAIYSISSQGESRPATGLLM